MNENLYESRLPPGKVHASFYTEQTVFDEEMDTIFHRGWVFVGHESEIPATGDYLLRRIGTQPLILLRNEEGGIQVCFNRCPHRGNMLLWKEKGNTRRAITCPYHAWSFNLQGALIDVPFKEGYGNCDGGLALAQAAAVSIYRGFVFACLLAEPAITLDQHLGAAKALLDRTCALSPEGEVELNAGWIKHKLKANWKLVAENNADGYHVGFVHRSFIMAFDTQYETAVARTEAEIKGVTRDWGNGHAELEFAPTYQRPLDWLTRKTERYATYIEAMRSRHGIEKADRILFEGPTHAMIFPNLFLAEMNVEIIQPVGTDEVDLLVTPVLLKGAPEVNRRSLLQTAGSFGPAAFIFADDAALAERNQKGLSAQQPEWMDIGRGVQREKQVDGHIEGHFTDEIPARAFWSHYRKLMTGARA